MIFALLVVLLPLCLFSIYLLNPGEVHSGMIYSYMVLFLMFVKLLDVVMSDEITIKYNKLFNYIGFAVCIVLLWSNIMLCNRAYFSQEVGFTKTYSNAVKLSARIEKQ